MCGDYDAKWTIYADWELGGVYHCVDIALDAYSAGANPAFAINYDLCGLTADPDDTAWVLRFGGITRRCLLSSSHNARRLVVMLETTGASTTDRNIDVKYTNLERRNTSWVDMNPNAFGADPNYTVTIVNDRSVNICLAACD